jgi:calcineurin-like phosphoesterase family protein
MMPSVFLTSDTHFGHTNICKFTTADGKPVRPWDNADEMDEALVANWNSVVRPGDKVYHCGDVVINKKALKTLGRLNGDKVLIRGNHDIFADADYLQYFRSLRGYHVMNGCILSHIPVHPDSLGRFGTNIHGHLHTNRVKKARGVDAKTGQILYSDQFDTRYYSVCVELHNFTPVLFEDVLKKIKAEGGEVGFRNNERVM